MLDPFVVGPGANIPSRKGENSGGIAVVVAELMHRIERAQRDRVGRRRQTGMAAELEADPESPEAQDIVVSVRRAAHSSSAGLFGPRRSLWGQVCITVPIKHVPTGINRLTASAPCRSSEAMAGRRSAMGLASFKHGWANAVIIDPDGVIQAMAVLTPPVGRKLAETVQPAAPAPYRYHYSPSGTSDEPERPRRRSV